ncbi:MAG: HAD family hydrolase [Rikenellaceae bacterium]
MDQQATVAIVYDFDGTLSVGNMQECEFIPAVGKSTSEFWSEADRIAHENDADSVLSYMERMLTSAREAGFAITAPRLRAMGRNIQLFDGLDEWFERINNYGLSRGVRVQHYVNSSGIQEMIEGSPIADKFHKIYASAFLYDDKGEAYWPRVAINYTNKTQFLFKINKGIETVHDTTQVNAFSPREGRPIPFSRIIFVGDGETDIPSMRLVHIMGGHSIAVYDPTRSDKREDMVQLIRERRVNYVCEANYTPESEMNTLVESIIDKIAADLKVASLQYDLCGGE